MSSDGERLVEIFLREYRAAVLQAFLVHDPALDGVVLHNAVGPFAELHGALVVDLQMFSSS